MATRQRTFISDLQNALVRIRNKTYGICSVTGELIDKKIDSCAHNNKICARKTTWRTGSSSKRQLRQQQVNAISTVKRKKKKQRKENLRTQKPVIITKVIKNLAAVASRLKKLDDEEDDELDEILKDLDSFTEGPEETFLKMILISPMTKVQITKNRTKKATTKKK